MNAFFDTLSEADEIEWFGNYHDWVSFVTPEKEKLWIEKRIEKKISIKLLMLPSEEGESLVNPAPEDRREYRILHSAMPFNCSFQIFSNKVLLWQPKTPLAVLIEDEYIAEMFRAIFLMLWEKSPVA